MSETGLSAVQGAPSRADDILVVEGLSAGYGRATVLHDISIRVGKGETVAVLGANGAGKSTLMRVVSGHLKPRDGHLEYAGRPMVRGSASARVRAGIVLAAEGHEIIGSLTVAENLALGAFRFWPRRRGAALVEAQERVFGLFPVLEHRHAQLAGLLSGGEQQMLAIGRSLMAEPDLLLLDEPSLGLAPLVVEMIYERLNELRASDLSILLVEQNSDRAHEFCDRTYVLRLGEVVAQGARGEIGEAKMRAAYFGD